MMRPTPQSIPISALQQEAGAQDLVRSEKMRPYLELLKAHIGGQDTAPYLAGLAELPLEERYVWRVISALKWAFCDLETENVLADLETLSEDDLKLVAEPFHPRKHDQVNHSNEEYARYVDGVCISINTVEGFFSLLKRGINGTFHHVSPQHLHRYQSEFDFKYSNRKITDGERSCKLIGKVTGKRLMYRDLIPPQEPIS